MSAQLLIAEKQSEIAQENRKVGRIPQEGRTRFGAAGRRDEWYWSQAAAAYSGKVRTYTRWRVKVPPKFTSRHIMVFGEVKVT